MSGGVFFQLGDRMSIVLLAFFASLCAQTTRCQLLSSPMNTIATSGQRVELQCSANLSFPPRWDFAEVDNSRFEFIYLNGKTTRNFTSRYRVDTSRNGSWTLVIDSADMTYAGTYRCLTVPYYAFGEIEMSVSAQLIITNSDPVCSTNASVGGVVEGDNIQMQCTFNYSGNWIPFMEWTSSNGRTVDESVQYTYDSNKVALSLIKQLTSRENGVTFMSKISLRQNDDNSRPAKAGEIKATNIPHYQHLWNYTTHVLYGPKNQIIMLIDDALNVESRLECFADGNPAPSYEWEIIGKNISLSKGSVLVISESMVSDEEQTLRCIAMNVVAGKVMKSEVKFIFNLTATTESNESSDRKSQTPLIIGLGSVCAVISCLLLAIIIYIIRRKVYKVAETQNAVPQNVAQPIYAVVKKERNGYVSNAVASPTNNGRKQQEIPVYAEVKKHENDKKKIGPTFNITSPTEEKPRQNYTGADGTQYEELSLINDQRPNAVPVQHNPMFSLVDTYASIDHTLTVPPPPVPKRH